MGEEQYLNPTHGPTLFLGKNFSDGIDTLIHEWGDGHREDDAPALHYAPDVIIEACRDNPRGERSDALTIIEAWMRLCQRLAEVGGEILWIKPEGEHHGTVSGHDYYISLPTQV